MPDVQVRGGRVQISVVDLMWAISRRWHVGDSGYAKTYNAPGKSPLRMHRLVLERVLDRKLVTGEYVDHINGLRLDNRRENLRLASKSQNAMNQSKSHGNTEYIGVHFDSARKRYMAYLNVGGVRFNIGRFASPDEGAWMYDQWAIELHGEFSRLNFEYFSTPTQQ
jgi:hypothetical protein